MTPQFRFSSASFKVSHSEPAQWKQNVSHSTTAEYYILTCYKSFVPQPVTYHGVIESQMFQFGQDLADKGLHTQA